MSIDVPHTPHSPDPPPPPLDDLASAAHAEGRLTMSAWKRLLSAEGAPIRAHARPVLRMAGTFLRNINPLLFSMNLPGGTELFESPEHEGLADGVNLQIRSNLTFPSSTLTTLTGGAQVNYRQTIALAGDFFGDPSNPISDGNGAAQQQARFQAAFNTLDTASSAYVNGIIGVMNRQAFAVHQAVAASTAPDRYSQAFSQLNASHYWDYEYNGATGGIDYNYLPVDPRSHYPAPYEGMYLKLAGTNWDHFGHHAVAAYQAGHAMALQQAIAARQATDNNSLVNLMMRAYIIDAFACHFLSDLFAAGHLRTPRKALHDSLSPFPDLLSQMMHDEDNYNGMIVTSGQHPEGWLCYGDKRLFDAPNATNLGYARAALQASADEVYAVAGSGTAPDPADYVAMSHIPNLDEAFDQTNRNNWKPLFIVPNPTDESEGNLDNVQIREPALDLRGNSWATMNDWYVPSGFPIFALYWDLLPSGGVHSVEGAPPSVVASWAHKFAWSQQGRFDHAMSPKITNVVASAAAITGSDQPAIITDNGGSWNFPSQGTDTLHLFYCQSGSTAIAHLTTPMSDVPAFTAPCVFQPVDSDFQTKGIPSVLEFNGSLRLFFPDISRELIYKTTLTTGGWTSRTLVFGTQGSTYLMRNNGAIALAKLGTTMYLAYRDASDYLHVSYGDASTNVWTTPQQLLVGLPVKASSNPSLTVTDGYLVLSVGGSSSSSGNPVVVYRAPLNASNQPGLWELFLNGVKDAAGDNLKVTSFAQLAQYSDAYAVVGTKPGSDRLLTIVPAHDSTPTGAWVQTFVQVGSAIPTTKNGVAVVFYNGNPYLIYADSNASNALSVVTSAVQQVTIQGGTQ